MHLRFWLPLLLGLSWLAAPTAGSRARAAARRLPLLFHVALEAGQPAADSAFLQAQLAHANAIFEPLGLTLECTGVRRDAKVPVRLVTREQRDGLGALLRPGVLNVFVPSTLMDVDEPGRERRGVHWRVRADPQRHLVILSAKAGPYVLAHELGHFFGNPAHSQEPGNLMSYLHTDAVPWLDPTQIARVQAGVERMVAQRELGRAQDARCFAP